MCAALVAFAPAAAWAQSLPRLHITALGLRSDRSVVRPGESFHVTVHVHVLEKRDRLDELVLPALTNAIDLGDERKRVPAAKGTDFYETLTVEAGAIGTASFTPAYIDAIDPATGKGMRYSSQPLSVRVSDAAVPAAPSDPAAGLLRFVVRSSAVFITGLAIVIIALFAGGFALAIKGLRKRRTVAPPLRAPAAPRTSAPAVDPLREALRIYRARGDDPSLDVLRNVLFIRAGAAPGATFADALRALGSRDPQLGRVMAVAERARFGPVHERAPAARDLLALLDAYVGEPVS